MTPLFSVIIPVFNRSSSIKIAIGSAIEQTCSDFEIVVVDDGSSDNIAEVMATYDDPRIRFVRQRNMGASAARNHGIDLARGRYVAFLDSDDYFFPHHLATINSVLKKYNEKTVVYSPVQALRGIDFVVRPPRAIALGETMANYLMCDRGFVQTSGLVVPAAAAKQVRYRADVSFGDDTDFAIRLQLAGYNFIMTSKPSVAWFDGPTPGRLSHSNFQVGHFDWLEDLKPFISDRAYRGYNGWHVAKSLFRDRPMAALRMYVIALLSGSYAPRLAVVVLAQILVPRKTYRAIADFALALLTRCRRTFDTARSA